MAKIPQTMDQDDVPERLGALETRFSQLLQKQNSMETHFADFAQQQQQTVSGLQSQIHAQAQQMHGQIESQNQSIQAMFETQLTQIRGLLSKRPREDGE